MTKGDAKRRRVGHALVGEGLIGRAGERRFTRLAALALAMFALASVATRIDAQETLIDYLEEWNYALGTAEPSDPPTAWREPGFDDSGWVSDAPTPIGYGNDTNFRTTLPTSNAGDYVSVYFRKAIDIADASDITALRLNIEFDDGFVLYINGEEAARYNMGPGGSDPAFDERSTAGHEIDDDPTSFDASAGLTALVDGRNVFAVQVHNTSSTSTDLAFNAQVVASTDVFDLCPSGITCEREAGGALIAWVNNPAATYTGISVTRDGTPIDGSPFPGDTEMALDPDGGGASHTYRVNAAIGGFVCPAMECTTTDSVSIIAVGEDWTFFRGVAEPSPDIDTGEATTAWTEVDFDDAAWETGPTGLGYADGDDATELDDMEDGYTTVYARKVFQVVEPGAIDGLALTIDYDDGFVAYLNGVEVARGNAGEAGAVLAFDAVAGGNHEAGTPEIFLIGEALVDGDNVLAVQGLNTAIGSSDFSLIPTLQSNPDLTPLCPDPASLACARIVGGVELSWTNSPAASYDFIDVFRNGTPIVGSPLDGDVQTAFDPAGTPGDAYEVVAVVFGVDCPALECTVPETVTIVAEGDTWSFFRGTEEPSPDVDTGAPTTAWAELAFDDAAWETGPSGFGYADGDDATVLADMEDGYSSVYARHVFALPGGGGDDRFNLVMDYDDGFIAYLNGVEIAREGVVEDPPAFNAEASGNREAGTPEFFPVAPALLRDGDNVLAVHGLNVDIDSSDFSLIPELVAGACVPVQNLECTADPDAGEVTLTWDTGLHDSFTVLRNGAPLPGSPFGSTIGVAVDRSPEDGDNVYSVIGVTAGVDCGAEMCTVQCGDLFPDNLTCMLSLVGGSTRASLAWTVRPVGTAIIDVVREGSVIQSLAAGATSYTDPDAEADGPLDEVSYAISFLDADGGQLCMITCGPLDLCPQALVCEVVGNGAAAVLTWENVVKQWARYALFLDGVQIAADIPGDATSYRHENPGFVPDVPVTYSLEPIAPAGEQVPCDLECDTTLASTEIGAYLAPAGGWDYRIDFDAGDAQYNPTPLEPGNLDGTWLRAADDLWDGTAPLEAGLAPDGAAPGGLGIESAAGLAECGAGASVLRMLDPGDPGDPGASLAAEFPDPFDEPNNATIVLARDLNVANANLLRTGVTLVMRWRIHPESPEYMNANETGDGSPISGGLGQIGVAFLNDGSLATDGASAGLGFTLNSNDLLQVTSNPVQELDVAGNTTFRSLWVTIEDPEGDNVYAVTTYTNGREEVFTLFGNDPAMTLQTPQLDVGAPVGNFLYIAMPHLSNDGDVQIDYVAVREGVHAPSSTLCAPCDNNRPTATIVASDTTVTLSGGGTASVHLDGSGSDDGDGGSQGLSYRWAKLGGPTGDTIATSGASETDVEFTAVGTYIYGLGVNDGEDCNNIASATVSITVEEGGGEEQFIRGDTDAGGVVAINDAIAIFNYLFVGIGVEPVCPDAADADDNGELGINDGIRILNVLFQGIGEIPAPGFTDCGEDPTPDALGPCAHPCSG